MRRSTTLASIALLAALVFAFVVQARRPKPVALIPTLTGQVEYCLTCHAGLPVISASHALEAFGCVICHGGERLALDANLAHSSLRGGKNPSDLTVVNQSCGGAACHSGSAAEQRDHIQRVTTSLQATYAGAIANMRYTFGAQHDLAAVLGVAAVQSHNPAKGVASLQAFDPAAETSPALQAFGKNCLNCHLSAVPLPGQAYARFTGCAACHSPRPDSDPSSAEPPAAPPVHRLTTAIAYSQCNACHNRGNYDLRQMVFQPRSDAPADRLHDYYQPIATFTRCEWTLDCIDCHTRQEAMGDGALHSSQKEFQYVRCQTCHGTLDELPRLHTIAAGDELALKLAFLNPVIDLKVGDQVIETSQGELLWNTRQISPGMYELFGKATGQRFTFRAVQGSRCQQKPDQQDSKYCHACHAVER